MIRTPDQRLRVFVSSTLRELAPERQAVRDAVTRLRLIPVLFELGARSQPPRQVYRAYLAQSQVFVGVYWQSYGWVAPGEQVSGLEDEYLMAVGLPRLLYVKSPAPEREPRLAAMLDRIREAADVSYQHFSTAADLQRLVENDLAQLLSERFEMAHRPDSGAMRAAGALPEPATPLVGRDQEAEAISDLVVREGVRLVTLTGPGGVGKSRLAVEAARRLASGFREGARFVDLSTVPSADLTAAAIAAGLGLSTSGGRLLSDLESYLHSRHLLLLLDNFEQVTGAAPLVTTLLGAAAGVVALVTSRMVLRLSGEHEFPVPTLAVPRAGADGGASHAQQYASVQLFTERAHAASAGFELTSENAEAVAEICRRLDGLPLAIELAAARIRLLPPQALLARIDDRLGLLTGGARDLPERQRTLRSTLDWSFGLLAPAEQALFACLGVFAGTFDLRAVAAVSDGLAASPDPGPVMDTLGSLVDSSLVRQEARTGEPRFKLLETIREYALQRLRDGADWRTAHDRHAAYFLALAEPAPAELTDRGQLSWLDRLEAEHDNLWAAMSWLVDGEIESAVRLFSLTWRFWWLHGHPAELARFEDQFVSASERLPPYQHALALTSAGFVLLANGDQARARLLFEQCLPLYRGAGERPGERLSVTMAATALGVLGRISALRGDEADAIGQLEESRALLDQAGTTGLVADELAQHLLTIALVHNFLGQIRLSHHDLDSATQHFREGLSVGRRAPDRVSILISLYDLAMSSQAAGELTGAAGFLHEGLSVAAEAGDETSVAYYLESLAAVAGQQDNPGRAVRLLSAAAAMLQARGSGWLHAYVPRAAHDDSVLAVLRSRLGDAAFAEAWARGSSIDGQRAVDFAREEG